MKVKIVLSIAVLTFGLLATTEAQGQPVITSVVRSGGASGNRTPIGVYTGASQCLLMQAGGFKDGNHVFSDRDYLWASTPNVTIGPFNKPLIGAEYVRTFNSDKANTGTVQYAVTISMQATVFVTVDNRFANLQTEVNNFTDKVAPAGTFQDTAIDVYVGGDGTAPGRPLSIFAAQLGPGVYIFDGATNSNNFYVIGAVPGDPTFNPPPAVNAGADQSTYVGGSVQLAGVVTDEGPRDGSNPGVLSWYWQKLSGPGTATFTPSDTTNVLDPTVTFSVKGVYKLLLRATDGSKDANDVMIVRVKERADEFLVGYWNFEDNVIDQSRNSNDGTIISRGGGGVYDPAAAIGLKAINLIDNNIADGDPNTNYVYMGPAPELDFSMGDWTVTAWVKTSQGSTTDANLRQQNIFSKGGDGGGGKRYVLAIGEQGDGRLNLAVDDNVEPYDKKQAQGARVINDGRWHFVAGLRDGDGIRVYVDGVLDGSGSLTAYDYNLSGTTQQGAYIGVGIQQEIAAGVPNTNPLNINGKNLNGLIDDVRVYNYALPLTDLPQYDSITTLTAMGPLVATINVGADIVFNWKPGLKTAVGATITDLGAPNPMAIMWSTESGPGQAQFDDPTSPGTMVGFPAGGVYLLKLTVIDEGITLVDTVQVTVNAPTCVDVIGDGLAFLTDLDKDCYVGLSDLALMLGNWALCNDPADTANCDWPF